MSVATIITEEYNKEQEKNTTLSRFFREFQIGKPLSSANFYKEKGVKPVELLRYLFELIFKKINDESKARAEQEYHLPLLRFSRL